MIDISNLHKHYKDTIATDIPSLHIHTGERIGLVGNNGAGKTTLLSLILDLIKADKGAVLIDGINVCESEDWKPLVSAYLDAHFVIDYLTPKEFFDFIATVRGISPDELQERLAAMGRLFDDQILGHKKFIRDLSKGNSKKVGIASALISQSPIVILDEPFANLDPSSQFELQRLLRDLSEKQTLIVSSHDLTHISEVCDRIVILEQGQIVNDLLKSENTLSELKTYFASKSKSNEI